ncbi:hypothetical protein D3C71_1244860 [compost metagenome]
MGPKRALSMRDCGCSMRNPIENGLASMKTPWSCSIWKVSRALWPTASTTWSASMCSPLASVTPVTRPFSRCSVSTLLEKRTSPPSLVMVSRMTSTMPTRRKVPMCGLATYRISSGAPARTNSFSTFSP